LSSSRYFRYRRLFFDVETDGLLDSITKLHCVVIYDPVAEKYYRFNNQRVDTKSGSISDGLEMLQRAKEIVGHNSIGFDYWAIKKIYPGWNFRGDILDTLTMGSVIFTELFDADYKVYRNAKDFPKNPNGGPKYGSQSVECWGYRLGIDKVGADISIWSRWTSEMEDRCVSDVAIVVQLMQVCEAKKYSQPCLKLEHDFKFLMARQENYGFAFDVKAGQQFYGKLSKRRAEIEEELHQVFPPRVEIMKSPQYWIAVDDSGEECRAKTKGDLEKVLRDRGVKLPGKRCIKGPMKTKEHPFNPASHDQIAERLTEKYGWKPDIFTDGGKPQLTETILKSLQYSESTKLAEYLMVGKRISMLAEGDTAWLQLQRNGRIYGSVNSNGTVTGRCTHNRPNIAQVPAVYSPYGKECRSLFGPSKGKVQVGWDASGLELRCLAHYLALYDNGVYAKTLLEADVHLVTCDALGLGPKEKYSFPSNHGTGRDCAKTWNYAFLYGAGDGHLAYILGRGKNAKLGKEFREKFLKKIPALFTLKKVVERTADNRGYLIGIDGRKLTIRSPHAALNTLLQSAGAIIMKRAAVIQYDSLIKAGLVWGKDFAFIANIHDEIQLEASPKLAHKVGVAGVEAIKSAGREFKFRCPLDGEYKVGSSWAATH